MDFGQETLISWSDERGIGISESLPTFAFLKVMRAVQDGNED
jgi:hypothetical protein